jgi:nitroreductase
LFEAADREAGIDDPNKIARSREKAANAPLVLAVVARLTQDHLIVPVSEQLVAIGGALEALLLAAEAFGYGAMMTSGDKVRSQALRQGLGLASNEELVGFVSMGTRTRPASPRDRGSVEERLSVWD